MKLGLSCYPCPRLFEIGSPDPGEEDESLLEHVQHVEGLGLGQQGGDAASQVAQRYVGITQGPPTQSTAFEFPSRLLQCAAA